MANWTKRVFGNVLWLMILSAVEVSGEAVQSQSTATTCSLTTEPWRVFPAGMVIDDYCALNVTVTVKRIDKSGSSCVPKVQHFFVAELGSEILAMRLKNSTVKTDGANSQDVISGCLILDNREYTGRTFESVVGEQVNSLQIKFAEENYPIGTCRWKDACSSLVSVSVDRAPVISAEVSIQGVDKQVKSVTQTKLMGMCCGDCDGNANQSSVSNVTVKLTASDDDWQWVKPTAETLKMQHDIKFRVVNSFANWTDEQLDATKLKSLVDLSPVAQNNTEVIRHVTRQSVCDWLKHSVELAKVVVTKVKFDVVLEMVVDASVQTGVDPKYLLKNSTSWSGLIRVAYRNSTDDKKQTAVLIWVAIGAGLLIVIFAKAFLCWKYLLRKRDNLSTNSNSCQKAGGIEAVDENFVISNHS